MATPIPHTNLGGLHTPETLVPVLNTNFQAVSRALDERLVGHRISVTRYAATGATNTRMPLGSVSPPGSAPWAVLLVRARETNSPGADLPVSTRTNFTQSADTLYIYEPQGLVENTFYDLEFLVLE